MDEWVDLEIASAGEEVARPDFVLREELSCAYFRENTTDKPKSLGPGTLKLSREGLEFTGADGVRTISTDDFLFLLLDDIKTVMVNTQAGFYRFDFKDPRMIYKWFFCHRLMKTGENK